MTWTDIALEKAKAIIAQETMLLKQTYKGTDFGEFALKSGLYFSFGDIEGFAVQDEVDREIVQRVREAGTIGVLPKDIAVDVNLRGNFNLKYYDVSRRILRMNRRLHFETEKCLFEKRGHHWALTKFAFDSYGHLEMRLKLALKVYRKRIVNLERKHNWGEIFWGELWKRKL